MIDGSTDFTSTQSYQHWFLQNDALFSSFNFLVKNFDKPELALIIVVKSSLYYWKSFMHF